MSDGLAAVVGRIAHEMLVEEVSVTPKPGLVDRNNPGAHRDMNYGTFVAGARALGPYFTAFARQGAALRGLPPAEIFAEVRPIGVEAEAAMFAATGGVNTHKGLIFSLGILSAAAGALVGNLPSAVSGGAIGGISAADLCSFAARMTEGIVRRDLESSVSNASSVSKKAARPPTKGERLFREYGIPGIRGEAESGFCTVRTLGLPWLRKLMQAHPDRRNDVLLAVLLRLMTGVTDTNVLGRHDFSALEYVQTSAARALFLGGPFTDSGLRFIEKMDREYIERNISPGGSADLLAVTIFLDRLERELKNVVCRWNGREPEKLRRTRPRAQFRRSLLRGLFEHGGVSFSNLCVFSLPARSKNPILKSHPLSTWA
jgi:triphosphoribosyl-dephospho-CoA synthase